jgi:hypothetical protein
LAKFELATCLLGSAEGVPWLLLLANCTLDGGNVNGVEEPLSFLMFTELWAGMAG